MLPRGAGAGKKRLRNVLRLGVMVGRREIQKIDENLTGEGSRTTEAHTEELRPKLVDIGDTQQVRQVGGATSEHGISDRMILWALIAAIVFALGALGLGVIALTSSPNEVAVVRKDRRAFRAPLVPRVFKGYQKRGPQGAQGATGSPGAAGPQGATGLTGEAGRSWACRPGRIKRHHRREHRDVRGDRSLSRRSAVRN